MKKTKLKLIILLSLTLISCNEKLTCDNEKAILIIKDFVKSDMVEAWALKLSADDFQDDINKSNYQGSRYDWIGNMNSNYKNYLLSNLSKIKRKEGSYYSAAHKEYINEEIILYNIVTQKYDETINKCGCTANIELTNGSKNKLEYDVSKDSEGELIGNYIYRANAMLDENTYASNFIKKYKDKVE